MRVSCPGQALIRRNHFQGRAKAMSTRFSSRQVCFFFEMASVLVLATSLQAVAQWQQGFDFRNTASFVMDPSGDTDVLSTTAYPTTVDGVTFGWMKTSPVQARDRNANLDPRLAGINFQSLCFPRGPVLFKVSR